MLVALCERIDSKIVFFLSSLTERFSPVHILILVVTQIPLFRALNDYSLVEGAFSNLSILVDNDELAVSDSLESTENDGKDK